MGAIAPMPSPNRLYQPGKADYSDHSFPARRVVMVKPLTAILVMLMLFASPAALAQPVLQPEPTDPLPELASTTYLDLVQLLVPGITVDGTTYAGGQSLDVKYLGSSDVDHVELAATGSLRIEAIPVRSGGLDRIALLLDFGTAANEVTDLAILTLFEVSGEPALLDATNVAFDRNTSFFEPALLTIGENNDLLITRSGHHNSGQGYATAALILVQDDLFELVDAVSTLRENTCAFERNQLLDVQTGAAEPLADIVATVTVETTIPAEPCSDPAPVPGTRTITVTYNWDMATTRYIPDSDALDILAGENETRF